jgi:type IV pilus assembly protein PilC
MENQRQPHARYLPADEISMFCEQVALILGSGVALYDGIEALCDNYKGTAFSASFDAIDRAVKKTGSLHAALQETRVFPPYVVQMARIGEQTGKLDEVMLSLSAYYAREQRIRRSVHNAVVYPICLIIMMAVVIVVLVTNVLPIFDQVYRSLGSEISATADALMRFGMGAGVAVLIVVGALILAVLVVALLMRTRKRQAVGDWLGRLFLPVRRLNDCLAAGRFSANMAMMLQSGYPLEDSLSLIEDVMQDPRARAKITRCKDRMATGESFPNAIEATGLFDPLHSKMIRIGVLTGRTDSVMQKLADNYQEQMDIDIARLIGVIEPTLVILLSVIIGSILLAVMLPMISIISSIL